MLRKITTGFAAFTLVIAAATLLPTLQVGAQSGTPSSKAAVAITELFSLSSGLSDASDPSNDSGWQPILSTEIKTSSQKDLVFDVALQCGLLTDTTVKSSGGSTSSSEARSTIAVRVVLDKGTAAERVAEPNNSIDAFKDTAAGVVYCDRYQKLEAKFAGLNCTADLETGAVTCLDPESLQLILRTMNANAFNFAADDVGSGVHTVTVEARAKSSVAMNTVINLAGAEAFVGAGSLLVEEVRLVKGAQIVID